jgi:hypothetical protein
MSWQLLKSSLVKLTMRPIARRPLSFRLAQPLSESVAIWQQPPKVAKPLPVTRSHSERSSTCAQQHMACCERHSDRLGE